MQLPTYFVRRTQSAPDLAATWDSLDWAHANVADVSHYHDESSAHRPIVQAKVLFDDDALYVKFRVFDRYVRAVETNDQGKVYLDSCAEFFVQPSEDASRGYFNFEMNAGGTLLLYHVELPSRDPKGPLEKFTRIPAETLQQIRRFHSLPQQVEPEITDDVEWSIAYAIPMSLLERVGGPLAPIEQRVWRANFYKCADATSHPHWGMWSPVDVLDFHQPARFGYLRFEV